MVEPFTILMTVASMASSMMAAQQQQRAAQAAAQQQMNALAKQKWEAYETAEKARKDNLKRTLAKRRARMGAFGLSAADGSAGAIIQGLRNTKAEESYKGYAEAQDAVDKKHQSLTSSLMDASKAQQRGLYQKAGAAAEGLTGISGLSSLVNVATSEPKDPVQLVEKGLGVASSLSNRFDQEQ